MRTILYIFSLLWFLTGIVLVALGMTLDIGPGMALMHAPETAQTHPVFGNFGTFLTLAAVTVWVWLFCMPALLLAALGTMLKRLEELAGSKVVHEEGREWVPVGRKKPLAEKVEPHIGKV